MQIIDIDKELLKNEIFNVGVDDNNATKNDILKIIESFADTRKVKILDKEKIKEIIELVLKK